MAWNEPGGQEPKDPWGDKKRRGQNGNNQGPPDLDEAIQQLLDNLKGWFGGNKSGGRNGGGNGKSSGSWGVLSIVAVLAVVYLLVNSAYTLDEQERGVVLRLGKYLKTEEPGLRFKIPVVDRVIPVNTTKVRESEIKERMLTKDENIVEVELNAQYRVIDPVKFALRVEKPELTLLAAAESALRHEVGSIEMDPILTTGRAALADAIQVRLQQYLDTYDTGMSLANVNIKDARPPSQVKAAFDDVQKAKQDKERFISEATAYANSVVPEARGRSQRQLEEANAYKEQVIARAEGEASRFNNLLNEYKKAPKVTRERLYLDAISNVYQKTNKVLIDVEGGNNMMYLPLDKLTQRVANDAKNADSKTSVNISELTDSVLQEIRQRQTTRREGR